MSPKDLKTSVIRGLILSFDDGPLKWSKKNVHGLINPLGSHNELEDPEIQSMLQELETEGLIRLHYKDDSYLEVLDPETYLKNHPIKW